MVHTGDKVEFNTMNFVESRRVTLAPYTLATKSTILATKLNVSAKKSTATTCRIHVIADLLPKPATMLNVSATKLNVYDNSRLCCRFAAGFGNSRLSTKSNVLNSTLLPVCTGLNETETKLNGGLSRLHSADEDAVSWLTNYG